MKGLRSLGFLYVYSVAFISSQYVSLEIHQSSGQSRTAETLQVLNTDRRIGSSARSRKLPRTT